MTFDRTLCRLHKYQFIYGKWHMQDLYAYTSFIHLPQVYLRLRKMPENE